MPAPEQIDAAIRAVSGGFDGMSGNCARFAVVLNRVPGGEGTYLLVDSGHYEFSDHVYLSLQGYYFDSTGISTRREIEDQYPSEVEEDEDDDEESDDEYYVEDTYTLEEFSDPSSNGEMIRRAVDSSNPMAAQWDEGDLEAALLLALADMGATPSPSA